MVPPELLNNLAVLLIESNRSDEAKAFYDEALTNCENLLAKGENTDGRLRALHLMTRFNIGCWLESKAKIGEATEIFKKILKEEPSYTDAYLRLAYLAKNRGDKKRALDYVD